MQTDLFENTYWRKVRKTLDKELNTKDNLPSRAEPSVHCFFEQSAAFKNSFQELGFTAYDYDLRNDFGQTDYVIDLFEEINKAYTNHPSCFDHITENDLIIAFFPCTKFEDQALLGFRGDRWQMKNYTDLQKLEYSLKNHSELSVNYAAITKMAAVCIKKNVPLIIENPYSEQHYLTRYWCLKPSIIDKDRRENGDYYRKPTQYFFIGIKPKQNLVFEPLDYVETENALQKIISRDGIRREVRRSLIHPQYASRFIRQYVVNSDNTF